MNCVGVGTLLLESAGRGRQEESVCGKRGAGIRSYFLCGECSCPRPAEQAGEEGKRKGEEEGVEAEDHAVAV